MEKRVGLLTNFLFILFDKYDSNPEKAAEKTALAIRNAISILYPKECNHASIRKDWIVKYCTHLRNTLDEIIADIKKSDI